MSKLNIDEIQRRYAAMSQGQFSSLKREELTAIGQQAYDREVIRRESPEWQTIEAQKDAEYVDRMEADPRPPLGKMERLRMRDRLRMHVSGWHLAGAMGLLFTSGYLRASLKLTYPVDAIVNVVFFVLAVSVLSSGLRKPKRKMD